MRELRWIIGVLCLCAAPAAAQLREYPDESLAGVRGVHVIVQYQAPERGAVGLTQKALLKAVEARLRADDIRVLDDAAWHQEPGEPYLLINVVGTTVDRVRKNDPAFVFSFSADLIQKVSLRRTPAFMTEGATWSQGYLIVVPGDQLSNVTMQISDVAHDFAGSLAQANLSAHAK